ncbi:YkvA family protein [Leptolyngbya iicbica]|uniref:DUF1232 domain-containing protein n=2 Tax=Cyanophyceae TaxID=3028117 RepID=A0A4Q7EIH0_9CYAN|nr:YkvA family protein [Leptolyngbya sp. LK]RZM82957.1 DUF1232 domain-containing protein [Leptolyngbya sp. LK]
MRYLIQAYRRLLTHPQYGIWVFFGSLLYLISPIDISPDIIPFVGQIDDVALIMLMASAATQWLSQQFLKEETAESQPSDEGASETVDVKAVEVD